MKQSAGNEALARARRLRRDATPAEHLLWQRLRSRQLAGAKFRRQVWLGPYIADFFCLELGWSSNWTAAIMAERAMPNGTRR